MPALALGRRDGDAAGARRDVDAKRDRSRERPLDPAGVAGDHGLLEAERAAGHRDVAPRPVERDELADVQRRPREVVAGELDAQRPRREARPGQVADRERDGARLRDRRRDGQSGGESERGETAREGWGHHGALMAPILPVTPPAGNRRRARRATIGAR